MNAGFVKTWLRRDVVGSTSDLARELVVETGAECPLLVTAARQTRGRGRGRHSWWSDAGSLTFTIAIDPLAHGLRAEHEPKLALATAVAVIDALTPWLPRGSAGIRWPNDIEVGGRKLGGLLPERVETPRGIRLLVGIGLNVLTRIDQAPLEIQRMATSLSELAPNSLGPDGLDAVLAAVLVEFESVLTRLAQDDPGLAARWRGLDTLRDRAVRLDLGPRIVRGFARGIEPSGALRVETGSETIEVFGGQVLRDP